MSSAEQAGISRTRMALYGVGSLGTGIYLTVPSVLLLYYLTEVLRLPPAWAGVAVFLPRAYDILLDPVMGWISDRTNSRWGRRRPFLLAGAIGTAVTFVLLFGAPSLGSTAALFTYVVLVYALSASAYTVFAVPYLAMPAEMSTDKAVRTAVMAHRMAFAMAGILIGAALAPWLVERFGSGRAGFSGMAWIVGPICAAAMLLTFFGTRRLPCLVTAASRQSMPQMLRDLIGSRSFRLLGACYTVQLMGLGSFNAAAPYFVTRQMAGSEADIGLFFLCLLGSAIVSMPLWTSAARRIGQLPAYWIAALAMVLATAGFWACRSPSEWYLALTLAGLMGIGFGGAQLLPFSLLADVINERSVDSAGGFTGAWTALEKMGLAVGPLMVGAALTLFDGSPAGGAPAQDAISGALVAASALPAAFVLTSLWPLARLGRIRSPSTGTD